VRALKGEEVEKEEFETSVDVDISAYIPSSYIKNEEQKLDVYKRIASIETLDDYLDMQDELLDRFGEMNSAVDNLLTVARVKSLAHNVYITEIKIEKQEVHMQFYPKAKVNLELYDYFTIGNGKNLFRQGNILSENTMINRDGEKYISPLLDIYFAKNIFQSK